MKKQSKIISEKEATICKKKETISHLEVSILENKTLIERLRRMLFGQKRERFEHLDNQLDIFSLISAEVKEELQKEVG